ncbi:hypothetical protein [Aliiroseovarius marinus]|uniref:hypothetical protein n=1 Tax=Aliiroseovarius marinus TaxID=2500159 RepID=UPI002494C3F2|nr:hypothetical protein [Aliiroseovarius marinus]
MFFRHPLFWVVIVNAAFLFWIERRSSQNWFHNSYSDGHNVWQMEGRHGEHCAIFANLTAENTALVSITFSQSSDQRSLYVYSEGGYPTAFSVNGLPFDILVSDSQPFESSDLFVARLSSKQGEAVLNLGLIAFSDFDFEFTIGGPFSSTLSGRDQDSKEAIENWLKCVESL